MSSITGPPNTGSLSWPHHYGLCGRVLMRRHCVGSGLYIVGEVLMAREPSGDRQPETVIAAERQPQIKDQPADCAVRENGSEGSVQRLDVCLLSSSRRVSETAKSVNIQYPHQPTHTPIDLCK